LEFGKFANVRIPPTLPTGSRSPRPNSPASNVEPCEQRNVIGNATPGGAALGDDQARNDVRRAPAAALRKHHGDSQLYVAPAEQIADVPQAGLDLGDVEDCGRRMERQQVDPPAVAVVVEARFGPDLPRCGRLAARPRVLKSGMVGIEEPVEVAMTAPQRLEREARIERPEQCAHRRDRIPIHPAELHVRYRRHAHAGAVSEVALAPPASESKGADRSTDAPILHRSRMARRALPAA
jgi:hypothetical protein